MLNENITLLYENEINLLKKQLLDINSKLELIKLQLKYFYNITNKQVRLKFISDIRSYLDHLKQNEYHSDDLVNNTINAKELFYKIESKVRLSSNNDKTVNYMISGLLEEVNNISLYSVSELALEFISNLLINLNKFTAMNYQSGNAGGLVLYLASLENNKSSLPTPDVIYYYGPISKDKKI